MIGCSHTSHRIPDHPYTAELILPECAGRDRWLAARRTGIGGSDVAALISASEYATAFDVYRAKTEEVPEITSNPFIEWGHRLEEPVATKIADELGLIARPGGGLWRLDGHEYAIVTPDRIATRTRRWRAEGLIECKTTGSSDGWENDNVPLQYQVQVQWQLGILGMKRAWIGCLVLNQERDFFLREITFDADWFAEMLTAARTFWTNHVLTGDIPMHDTHHPRTDALLKQIHPAVIHTAVELPEDSAKWVAKYHELKADEKRIATELRGVTNWFRMHMEDAKAGYVGEEKIAWLPEVTNSGVDTGILKRDFPEAYEAAKTTSTHRRLTVRKPSGAYETKLGPRL